LLAKFIATTIRVNRMARRLEKSVIEVDVRVGVDRWAIFPLPHYNRLFYTLCCMNILRSVSLLTFLEYDNVCIFSYL
jgi:hypothetical protein